MQIFMEIKYRLAELREQHPDKPTQRQMAAYLGMEQESYWRLEHNKRGSIKNSTLLKLCKFFNCTPNEILWHTTEDDICQEENKELVKA